MKSTKPHESEQESLLKSLERGIELLKATAHDTRLQILIYLLESEKSFPYLHKKIRPKQAAKVKISKTALSHHLNQLIETGLVEKTARGMYSLTDYGSVIIEQVRAIISTSQNGQTGRPRHPKQFTDIKNYLQTSDMSKNLTSTNPVYQSGWNSYISTVSGILEALGMNDDYVYLSGRSGFCFIFKMPRGPSSYLGEGVISDKAWKEIYEGTESFGWKITEWRSQRVYPHMWNLTGEDFETAKEMFYRIRFIIDQYDTPVALWGVRVPNFGIVKGYDDDSYIVSTYYRKESRKDTPVRYDSLYPLGTFKFLYFTKSDEIRSVEEEDKKSIIRAIKMAKGIDIAPENPVLGSEHIAGLEAYDEFARTLLNFDMDLHPLVKLGTAFYSRFYHDAKCIAMEYLERVARKYASLPQAEPLIKASKEYRAIKNIFDECMELFPYFEIKVQPSPTSITDENRKRGAKIILDAQKHEKAAISFLEEAVDLWEFSSR
ncbi:MAG: ArsR/SmtB family transcription factor [Candidatus Hermodarchaeota archaeon]